MTCDPLATTGLEAPVLLILAMAATFVFVGLWLLLRTRRSTTSAVATLMVIVAVGFGVAIVVGPASPSLAAPSDCASPDRNVQSGIASESATESESDFVTESPTESGTASESATAGPDNSLTITQTSTMENLAPGVAPADITGLVVNNGPDSTFITAIAVEIDSVTRKTGSAEGACDASDYVLIDAQMSVGKTLAAAGGSASFAGASIGFNNKSVNQDACQGATVLLRYTTVPA